VRRIVEEVTPPVLLPALKRLAHGEWRRQPPEWEYVPEGWSRPRGDLRGWNDPSVLEAYRSKRDAYAAAIAGTGPLAFDSSPALDLGTPNADVQNAMLTLAYSLVMTTRGRDRISILDWGGGLALDALTARAALPAEVEMDYHCKDVPIVADHGRSAYPDVTFWSDDRCFDRQYDFVFASSSLQYSEDWQATLTALAGATTDALLLTRMPIVLDHPSFVVLQRAHHYRFDSEYLGWVFNRDEVFALAEATHLTLEREFVLGYRPDVAGAPEQDETWAFLFRRR
jgi:putative methyltransferase (TIGR04325 family)